MNIHSSLALTVFNAPVLAEGVELTERGARLDGNHPLAGTTVTWVLALRDVRTGRQFTGGVLDHQPSQRGALTA